MIIPAIGIMTVSERVCIMENMLLFHACGVAPTSAAMLLTL